MAPTWAVPGLLTLDHSFHMSCGIQIWFDMYFQEYWQIVKHKFVKKILFLVDEHQCDVIQA